MTLEKRLDALVAGIDEIKEMQSEFDVNNERFEQLLARMDEQLRRYETTKEEPKEPAVVSNGASLGTFGLLKKPKPNVAYYLVEDDPEVFGVSRR